MANFTAATDASQSHLTLVAANAALEAANPGTYTEDNKVQAFHTAGGDFTDILAPSSSNDTGSFRWFLEGIALLGVKPKLTRGTTGVPITINHSNFTIDGMNIESDTQVGNAIIAVGSTATAANGIIKNCDAHGLDVDSQVRIIRILASAADTTIFNNVFSASTRGDNIRIDSSGSFIFNNQFFDVAGGITLTGTNADDTEIYFNTILGRSGSSNVGIQVQATGITGLKIKNNIIQRCDRGMIMDTGSDVELDFSSIFGSITSPYRDFVSATDFNLTDWRSTFGLSGSSIEVDPELVNIGAGSEDLHLQATSPCRGAGVAIVGIDDDFDGDARATPPAMGMDEIPAPPGPIGGTATGNVLPTLVALEHESLNIEALKVVMHGFDLDTSGDFLPIKVTSDGKLEVGP